MRTVYVSQIASKQSGAVHPHSDHYQDPYQVHHHLYHHNCRLCHLMDYVIIIGDSVIILFCVIRNFDLKIKNIRSYEK